MANRLLVSQLEELAVALSNWLVLTSFVEAHSWHFTDPQTLGVSAFGLTALFVSTWATPIIFCFKGIRQYRPRAILILVLKLLPSFLLFIASLPSLREHSWSRTAFLGLGVSLLPFTVSWIFFHTSNDLKKKIAVTQPEKLEVDENTSDPTSPNEEYPNAYPGKTSRNITQDYELKENAFFIAVVINMCFRYCSGSMNIFYENWIFSLSLFIVTFTLVTFRYAVMKTIAIDMCYENMNAKLAVCQNRNDSNSLKIELIGPHYSPENEETSLPINNDAAVDEIAKESKGHLAWIGVAGCFQGFTVGMLVVVFFWFFSTANMLPHWARAGLETYKEAIPVIFCYTIGVVLSIVFPPQDLLQLLQKQITSYKLKTTTAVIFCALVAAVLITLQITATAMLLQSQHESSFVGALMICLILPYIFSINVHSLTWTLSFAKSSKSTMFFMKFLPSIISILISFSFVITHSFFVFFIVPIVTSFFLGNMDLILTLVLVTLLLTVIVTVVVFAIMEGAAKNDYNFEKQTTRPDSSLLQKLSSACKHKFYPLAILFTVSVTAVFVGPRYTTGHCLPHYRNHISKVANVTNGSYSQGFSVVTWNILLAHDFHGRDNLPCVAKVLQNINANVIGLQESDMLTPFWGAKYVLGYLSGILEIKSYPGNPPLKGTLGVGMLTSLKVIDHQTFILPSRRDNVIFRYSMNSILCVFQNKHVRIINVHGVYKNMTASYKNLIPYAETSHRQMKFVVEHARNSSVPTIVMGDLNTNPRESSLDVFYEHGFNKTLNPDRELKPPSSVSYFLSVIDHIFYKGLILRSSRIITETNNISDHHPVVAEFEIPE